MILVTGGTGLIGSHLLLELLRKNLEVKAIYRNQSNLKQVLKVFGYYTSNAQEYFDKIIWVKADLNDIPALENAFENVHQLYHCAALISFDPNDFKRLQKINKVGTENIVNLSLAFKIDKLCYLSSIAALGRSQNGGLVDEDTDFNDSYSNVYALSKYQAEMEVWRGAQEGLNICILNPGVVLGPGFWNNGSGLFFTSVSKKLRYYPPGATGFVGVKDLCRLMVKAMNSSIKNERFIVISKNMSYKEVLNLIALAMGLKPPGKKLKNWQLQTLWRLDWVRHFITRQKRKLTQNTVFSLNNPQSYNNEKVSVTYNYSFESVEDWIAFCCQKFKEEN
ncbi:MAG: NAD-dependent epimerase/dehydratase family protein [Eudoraea sp.]|uniref:NAD-dependent epimerase/dehydratase family protein n=1 Tax=Eudoraea sp. TaxID=1979955 RepID=UPI003C77D396